MARALWGGNALFYVRCRCSCMFMLDKVWPHLEHHLLLKIGTGALILETPTHEPNTKPSDIPKIETPSGDWAFKKVPKVVVSC